MTDAPQPDVFAGINHFNSLNSQLAGITEERDEAPVAHRSLYTRAALAQLALNQSWLAAHPEVRGFYDEVATLDEGDRQEELESIKRLRGYRQRSLLTAEDLESLEQRARLLKLHDEASEYLDDYELLYPPPAPEPEITTEPLVMDVETPVDQMITPDEPANYIPIITVEVVNALPTSELSERVDFEVNEELKKSDIEAGAHGRVLEDEERSALESVIEDELQRAVLNGGAAGQRLEEMRKVDGSPLSRLRMDDDDFAHFKDHQFTALQRQVLTTAANRGLDLKWIAYSRNRGRGHFLVHSEPGLPVEGEAAEPVTPEVSDMVPAALDDARVETPVVAAVTAEETTTRSVREAANERTQLRTAARFSQSLTENLLSMIVDRSGTSIRRNFALNWITDHLPEVTEEEAGQALDNLIQAGHIYTGRAKGSLVVSGEPVATENGKTSPCRSPEAGDKSPGNSLNEDMSTVAEAIIDYLCIDMRHISMGDTANGIAAALRGKDIRVDAETVKLVARRLASRNQISLDPDRKYRRGRKGMIILAGSQDFKNDWLDPVKRREIKAGWRENTARAGEKLD